MNLATWWILTTEGNITVLHLNTEVVCNAPRPLEVIIRVPAVVRFVSQIHGVEVPFVWPLLGRDQAPVDALPA